MDTINKIVLARSFDIPTWLVSALNQLVQRDKPIDSSEGNRLGMEWVLKIAELRECDSMPICPSCRHTGPARCSSCSSVTSSRCGSCYNNMATAAGKPTTRGNRSKVDYSEKIREIFNLGGAENKS